MLGVFWSSTTQHNSLPKTSHFLSSSSGPAVAGTLTDAPQSCLKPVMPSRWDARRGHSQHLVPTSIPPHSLGSFPWLHNPVRYFIDLHGRLLSFSVVPNHNKGAGAGLRNDRCTAPAFRRLTVQRQTMRCVALPGENENCVHGEHRRRLLLHHQSLELMLLAAMSVFFPILLLSLHHVHAPLPSLCNSVMDRVD